ncbi:MAG: MBL fold metallo-hydrolase [Bacteroidetes bacterium]|nr:MBL fold metallo-hydrolase [Bacteroidota bacterium]
MIIGIIASLIGFVVLITIIFITTSPQFGAVPGSEKLIDFEASKNFEDGKFRNEKETDVSGKMEWGRTLREWFTTGDKAPSWSLPVKKITSENITVSTDSITKITWFGHSAILLEMQGKKIFIDPMLGAVPAPHPMLGSKRFNDTLPLTLEELPFLDAVLISHDHYDHLDYESIIAMKDKVGHFYTPLGVGGHLESWGVSSENITEMDWWEHAKVGDIQLTSAPARHFSGRGFTDRFKTQWCSWIIKGVKDNIYFSGDSGYDDHFKRIGEKYGPFDLAIMECGQYDEQWPLIHMMPEETVQATKDVKGSLLLPIHWGSFKLSLHSWEDPIERVSSEANQLKVPLTTPIIGESIILGETPPQSLWWKK